MVADILPDEQVDEFLRWYGNRRRRTKGRSPAKTTLRNKAVHLRAVARLVEQEFPGTPPRFPEVVSNREVFQWVLGRMEARWSSGSVRNLTYALRDFGAYCVALGLVSSCCVEDDDVPPKNPDPVIETYTEAEMERFCEASWAKGVRWGVFINLLCHTGRRVGEVLGLEWDWFRLHEQPPHIWMPTTKNGNQDYIVLRQDFVVKVLTPERMLAMRGEQRDGRNAFKRDPSVYPFPWSYGTARNRHKRFCLALGIPYRGFHNFRHTVITERLASGMPIQAVATLAGHANVGQTWSRYSHATALSYAELLERQAQ